MPAKHPRTTVRFGLFELDPEARELYRGGIRIRLAKQPFDLLSALIECPGQVISREALQQQLWPPNTFVDYDHGLNKTVRKLREVLGDSAESPRYVETVQRIGYRFIAPVTWNTNSVESSPDPPLPPVTAQSTDTKPGVQKVPAELSRRTVFWLGGAAFLAGGVWLRSTLRNPTRERAIHVALPLPAGTHVRAGPQ